MKKLLAILAAGLISFGAQATVLGPDTINTNTNTNTAVAAPTQGQQQGQGQFQGQATVVGVGVNNRIDNDVRASAYNYVNSTNKATSGSVSGAYSGGNSQNVTVTDSGQMHYSGSYEVKNVPNAIAPTVYPTSPCMGSSSAGASGVGFGVSFGSSWTDDECGIRETARSFAGMGMKDDAVAVICSSKYAAVAPACKKAE